MFVCGVQAFDCMTTGSSLSARALACPGSSSALILIPGGASELCKAGCIAKLRPQLRVHHRGSQQGRVHKRHAGTLVEHSGAAWL